MSIKCILVPIAGAPDDSATMRAALHVSEQFSAQIQVLYAQSLVEDLKPVSGRGFDTVALNQIVAAAREAAEKSETKVRAAFGELLGHMSVENAKGYHVTAILDVVEARPSEAVVERGGVFDLLIVAHPTGAENGAAREIAEAAMFHTGRPVLMMPQSAPRRIGERILIGWNRSPQAGRAVANAMPFLERAETVFIYSVETGAKKGPSPGHLRHYLKLHGIDAELIEQLPDRRSVGEMLLSEARNIDADLIVMGAYSNSRLRERVLGGVTQQIFSSPVLPVLMAR